MSCPPDAGHPTLLFPIGQHRIKLFHRETTASIPYTIDDLRAWLCCESEWQTNPSTVLLAIPGLRLFVDIRRGDNEDLIAQWLVEDGVVDNA